MSTDPLSYTGKWFYYSWELGAYPEGTKPEGDGIDAITAKSFIWNLDVGMGGNLGKMRINPVIKVDMKVDANNRAQFINSDLN